MSSHVSRPAILDKRTDPEPIRQIKDEMRRHLDDYLDFAETQPQLVAEWKASPMPRPDGKWRTDAERADAIRFLNAARGHFKTRHPDANAMEATEAYSSYECLVRGRFVEGWKPSRSAVLDVVKQSFRQQFTSPWLMRRLSLASATLTVCAVLMTGLCLMGVVTGKAVAGNAVGSLIFACAAFVFVRAFKAIARVRQASQ